MQDVLDQAASYLLKQDGICRECHGFGGSAITSPKVELLPCRLCGQLNHVAKAVLQAGRSQLVRQIAEDMETEYPLLKNRADEIRRKYLKEGGKP